VVPGEHTLLTHAHKLLAEHQVSTGWQGLRTCCLQHGLWSRTCSSACVRSLQAMCLRTRSRTCQGHVFACSLFGSMAELYRECLSESLWGFLSFFKKELSTLKGLQVCTYLHHCAMLLRDRSCLENRNACTWPKLMCRKCLAKSIETAGNSSQVFPTTGAQH